MKLYLNKPSTLGSNIIHAVLVDFQYNPVTFREQFASLVRLQQFIKMERIMSFSKFDIKVRTEGPDIQYLIMYSVLDFDLSDMDKTKSLNEEKPIHKDYWRKNVSHTIKK